MAVPVKRLAPVSDYDWFRRELDLAQRGLKLAAQRYGALTNQRSVTWTADRERIADAFVELEEAARAYAYAEQLFMIAAREVGGPS